MWHILFISNFNSHMKQCLATTWYLPCEMQLYILSPIFLILFIKTPMIGYVFTVLCISLSCFLNFIITMEYKLIDGPGRLAEHYSID
ncbi:unnamed protein product, partial [Larinioides sclopetarius]